VRSADGTKRASAGGGAQVPNLAALHEAIAEALPDEECLVFGERRFSWRAFTDRTRRLAAVLRSAGLGCHSEPGSQGMNRVKITSPSTCTTATSIWRACSAR
jgi:non-ribosomal peptide synthetase component E (peptide arylation enzyme)